ncbi:MAG: PaaX family transcriptional regulator C-terminal domain-containing protein [Patescibacteria group bacterium]|nr:PaaX family transcriptional regulator C-terminal domain-containing protein [Patescibacteria group bacterium]
MRILKTKLLFALASEKDFLRKTEGYEYKTYDFLYFRLSEFEPGSVRDAAIRLTRSGSLDKIIRGNQSSFRLTGLGREKLLDQLPIYRGQRRVWDRIWRIVIVKKLGNESRQVGRSLGRLGYKRVARGVYVTPFSVSSETKKLFLANKWQEKGQIIESRKMVLGDDLKMARQLWELDQTSAGYLEFINQADRLLKFSRRNIILLQQSKGGFKGVFDKYFYLLLNDPGLPKKLLPPDWQADKAEELFSRLVVMAKTAGI